MKAHDDSYKAIFTHPEIIQQLLQDFVKQDWVKELDFSTLEKTNDHYVSEDLRERFDDMVWKVRWQQQDLYVYLLIEFQSEPEYFMPVRMMTYIGLLYQDLIKSQHLKTHDKLPPVMPIVLHRGQNAWKYPLNINELIAKPNEILAHYCPNLSFFLIDECQYPQETLMAIDNALATLFQLEQPSEILVKAKQVARLFLLVKHAPALERVFRVWVDHILAMRLENPAAFKAATNLEEIAIMLEECVDSWVTQWRNDGIFQGRQEGLQKGRQEGRQEGEVLVLKKLLRKRFGNLPSWVDDKLGKACANELEFWVEAILDAKTLDEVFLVRADF
jgi:predicted transposase/invertase (TIGR01784 family)